MKLQVWIVDNNRLFKANGKYQPENRIVEVRRGFSRDKIKFAVNPDDIYRLGLRGKPLVIVDLTTRTSIALLKGANVDSKLANQLDYHTEKSFWKALMQQHKIPISTLLITLFAGMGVYLVLVTFLRVCGFNV